MKIKIAWMMFFHTVAVVLPISAANVFIDAESEAEWAAAASDTWAALTGGDTIQFPDGTNTLTAVTIGCASLMISSTPSGMEIEAQRTPEYRTASGTEVPRFTGSLLDPLDGQNAHSVGGAFIARPPPFDHTLTGQPMGLKIMSTNSAIALSLNTVFNRIGVRFNNTPAGRLLFLYEMSNGKESGSRWYANEFTMPIGGGSWRPGSDFFHRTNPETHLRKLIVLQLEPYNDPTNRIPEKLTRSGLTIDYTASSLSDATSHINSYATDANLSTNRPYVIQLPSGLMEDRLVAAYWINWCQKLNALTGGRKVWLVGQPDTQISSVFVQGCSNLGVVFCRIGRSGVDYSGDEAEYEVSIGGPSRNLDLRNNWIECPDGVSEGSVYINAAGVDGLVVVDNILSGAGAGIAAQGGTVLLNSVIARNWIERANDGVQMYGGWYDVVVAYNHFASASGFANRDDTQAHWGAALHADCFQSQANFSTQRVQKASVFCNFSQFGRHNWPGRWYELGSGEQNVIVDSDAYEYTHFYWNMFQNVLPAGHRGLKTISPDYDYAMAQTGYATNNWIKNFTVMGNAFLDRWDHSNRKSYGYRLAMSSVAGLNIPDYFELVSSMNIQGSLAFDYTPVWYSTYLEGRPDPAAMTGWKTNAPTLNDFYQHPIIYTGSMTNGYEADFSQTAYAANKLLRGWCAPTDYSPATGWETTAGGNPILAPGSELEKVAAMPVDAAAFFGDSSRTDGYFDELSETAFNASPLIATNLWCTNSLDDGFLLHIKFGSVGTPGTHRELLSETEGSLRYEVALTTNNTARYLLTDDGEVLSEVETVDTFADGDHLTMQVYTPFHPIYVEQGYVSAVLGRLYHEGMCKVRYWFSPEPPAIDPVETNGVLNVWMNMTNNYHFYHFEDGEWKMNMTELSGIHSCALRTFSTNRAFSFNMGTNSAGVGTAENFRRDVYPVETNEWRTLYLDGPAEDYTTEWTDGDLLWRWDGRSDPVICLNVDGVLTGASGWFTLGAFDSGRPRCFIRHNIDHQDKAAGWIWTPDVDLPHGNVVLFNSFDGTCESIRIIRGGQGEYGPPATSPAYRVLETVGSAMSFIRPAVNSQGLVPGWGTPDLYLHSGASGNAGRGGDVEAYTPPSSSNDVSTVLITNTVNSADQAWASDGSSVWVNQPTVRIGTMTTPVTRGLVMPFWIPDLEGRQVLGAELKMWLSTNVSSWVTGSAHADLYGVRSDDSSPTTSFADYTNGTLLVDNWFAIHAGLETEQATSDAALASWISGQTGTTGGKYVFFSVKPDAADSSNWYATFHTGDSSSTNLRPMLVLTLGSLGASFSASPLSGNAPLTVAFTDTSSGGTITNRYWDFGDGSSTNTTLTSISHSYAAGTYSVALTVSGPAGSDTETESNLIAVAVSETQTAVTGETSDRQWYGSSSSSAVGDWVAQQTARAGSGTQPLMYKHVIPFQLPDIGDDTITGVELSAWLISSYQWGTPDVYVDVYAGRVSTNSTTQAGDWDVGQQVGNNMARIASTETAGELKTVSLDASYFQNIYDNDPAAAGKYLFLVLSPDDTNALTSSSAYCTWASADSISYVKPVLTFTTVAPQSSSQAGQPPLIIASLEGPDSSLGAGQDVVTWTPVPGYVYSVWFSTNLQEGFLPVETNLPYTVRGITNKIDAPAVFYQIRTQ